VNQDIKVIFISGYAANIIHRKDIIAKGLDFITKPISHPDLALRGQENPGQITDLFSADSESPHRNHGSGRTG
jgi:CheY-like chemotaxis protein